MIGEVDQFGRAVISIDVAAEESGSSIPLDVWIDTGFTGELVLPLNVVDTMSLGAKASVDAVLADGQQSLAPTYGCWVDWFGTRRQLEAIGTDIVFPLLGVGLLVGHELTISYSAMTVKLE